MSITLSSTGLPVYFVDQFQADIYHVCQQEDSKFAQGVRTVPVVDAEWKSFDIIGKLTLEEKTARNVETPAMDPTTQRRWVGTTPYHQSVLYDKDDDLEMIAEPTSDFVLAFRAAINRTKDDIILAAFEAATTSGRSHASSITWASQEGDVKYTIAGNGRTIPFDCAEGNCVSGDTMLSTEKIELAKEYFAKNDCPESDPIWMAIGPRQATNLFGQEEYVNIDYNASKPLADGRIIRDWMGINWIVSPKIVIGSSNDVDGTDSVYENWCWKQSGMILGVADAVTVRITEESMLSYSQRVYAHMKMGAMRLDEDKVIKIESK